MLIAYSGASVNKTATSQPIHGNVIVRAEPAVTNEEIVYSVASFHFFCGDLEFSGTGGEAGKLRLLKNPQGEVSEVASFWTLGEWLSVGNGLTFTHMDNSPYGVIANNYLHLPPRIRLGCDGEVNGGPFQPGGSLLLIWNPLFLIPNG